VAPQVSSKEAETTATAQAGQPRRKERTASAAAPGFSFK